MTRRLPQWMKAAANRAARPRVGPILRYAPAPEMPKVPDSIMPRVKAPDPMRGPHLTRVAMRAVLRLRCAPQWLRALAPLLVFWTATALLCIVPVDGAPLPSILEAAYGALGLFAASPPGLPPAHPDLGSPMGWAALALWGVYFVAPGLVVTVLANALLTMLLAPERLVAASSGHTVILGLGAHGRVLRQLALEAGGPRAGAWQVVTLDQAPAESGVVWGRKGRACLSLRGDLQDEQSLLSVGIQRASRIFISTGSATLNEAVARRIRAMDNRLPPDRLLVLMDETDDAETALPPPPADWTSIPQYDEAAREMWSAAHRRLVESARDPALPLRIVILGLGRFGRALLRALLADLGPTGPWPADQRPQAVEVLLVDPRHPGPGPTLRNRADDAGIALETRAVAAECWVDDLAVATSQAPDAEAAAGLLPDFVFSTIDDDNTALMCKRWLDQLAGRWGGGRPVHVGLRLSWAPMHHPGGADPGPLVCSVLDHFRARMRRELR